METIKVVLADDHEIVRNGIKFLLESEGDIKVIGEASNGEEALNQVKELSPDILVTDIRMPVLNGIEALHKLQGITSSTKAIVLSMHDDEEYITQSVQAGASGYLLKDASKPEFLKAIRTVNEGHNYYSGDVSEILVKGFLKASRPNEPIKSTSNSKDQYNLTKREKEILSMLYEGSSNKDIARKLDKSVRTIETHRFHIMKKLDVSNVVELFRKVDADASLQTELKKS